MKKNMGSADRIIRAVLAVGLLALGLNMVAWTRYLFLALGAIMAITSVIGVCPMYYPMGINTMGRPKRAKRR